MVEVQQSYREFLGKVDKLVSRLPQFMQQEIIPTLFQAWGRVVNTVGVGDDELHIELFVRYALNLTGNRVYRDILLAILQNAWEGLA